MLTKKNIKITRSEALKYLFMDASPIPSIISCCVSNLFVFLLVFFVLYLGKFVLFSLSGLIISGSIFFLFGIPQYYIKKQEFTLFEKTSSDIFLNDIISYPFYLLLFGGLFTYYFVPQWISSSSQTGNNVTTIVVTIFIIALLFSFIFNSIWKLVSFYLLGILSGKDWFLMAEKDYFISILALRFQEAKRYNVPLSVVSIRLEAASKVKNNKRILIQVYNKISTSLREIDTISHFNEWNTIYMLSPITNLAAKGLLERILRLLKELVVSQGIADKLVVECSVSSIRSETQTEFDMLQPNYTTKEEFSKVSN